MSSPDTLTRELAALDDALAGRPVDPDLAELGELAQTLREDRPEPSLGFGGALDRRVASGFREAGAARRSRRWLALPRIPLPALGVAASLLLVVVVATSVLPNGDDDSGGSGTAVTQAERESSGGGSAAGGERDSGGSGSTDSGSSTSTEPASPDTATSAPQSKSSPSVGGPAPAVVGPLPSPDPPSPSPSPGADRRQRRQVERSAELTLAARPRDIDKAAAGILRVTDMVGGYVVSSTVSSGSSGQFALRVPERRLTDALSRLSRVAKVRERTQSAQDITAEVVSARERLTDARTERRALLRQLAKADTTNETASIRARLRLVSGQIAAAKRDLRRVQTRASYSSIAVTLLADRRSGGSAGDGDGGGGWTAGDALDDAVRILEVSAGVLLVAAAVALPVGLLALLAWLTTRHAAQRRRERALDAV